MTGFSSIQARRSSIRPNKIVYGLNRGGRAAMAAEKLTRSTGSILRLAPGLEYRNALPMIRYPVS